ncbi:hypothetical protein [Methylocystis bryophila]|nr:hypothetical protein [Methylocystis bryophila]BDV41024.1 hypothetical protein DSM21852_42780 [Methylocystis bryophila]
MAGDSPKKTKLSFLALLLFAVLLPFEWGAAAEIRITGTAEAMNVEVKEVLLNEFLVALNDKFGLSFHSTAPLDKLITGSFHGSLERVVSSVLFSKDYNYLYRTNSKRPILVIIGIDHGAAGKPTDVNSAIPRPRDQSPPCADQTQRPSNISAKYLNAHAQELAWRPCASKR